MQGCSAPYREQTMNKVAYYLYDSRASRPSNHPWLDRCGFNVSLDTRVPEALREGKFSVEGPTISRKYVYIRAATPPPPPPPWYPPPPPLPAPQPPAPPPLLPATTGTNPRKPEGGRTENDPSQCFFTGAENRIRAGTAAPFARRKEQHHILYDNEHVTMTLLLTDGSNHTISL